MINLLKFIPDILAIIISAVVVVIAIIVILIVVLKGKKKKSLVHQGEFVDSLITNIISSMGGLENITKAYARLSRLYIEVKDSSTLDTSLIEKDLPEIIKMENKIVIVVGEKATSMASSIQEKL